MATDLYEELNVKKTSTEDEIKHAFRKRAKKDHPDKGGNHADFIAASKAYAILSDPIKRKRYDETGNPDVKNPEDEAPGALQEAIEILLQNIFKGRIAIDQINFIDELKKIVQKHTNDLKKKLRECKKDKHTLEYLKDRLSLKDETGADFISVGLDRRSMNLDLNIKEFERLLDVDENVLSIIDGYLYEAPEGNMSVDFRIIFGQEASSFNPSYTSGS